ncbi:hypothetical protein M0802_008474 [Mischocyttarus mexicanus]|nr:hypothetical protein M0802_008474 [Mischocyttarus mexicanus]
MLHSGHALTTNILLFYYFGSWVLTSLLVITHEAPQDIRRKDAEDHPREAYFNGSAFLKLNSYVSVHRHSGLSFRTCEGGRLFVQRYKDDSITLEVTQDGLLFVAIVNQQIHEAKLNARLLNNAWHNVNLFFRLGNLTLSTAGHTQVIANATYNSAILTLPDYIANNSLIVGENFRGCILQGPGILFNESINNGAILGPCTSDSKGCVPSGLGSGVTSATVSTMDVCRNEPCMMHGKCVSRQDRYECHCYARYSGNNCQIDNGSPCLVNPCRNGGICIEDKKGDFTCNCQPGYTGASCESQLGVRLCEESPCKNNGVCLALADNEYKCECSSGWTGKNCETNINECSSYPCKHGGRCIDGINNYTCICDRTGGFEGQNCELNLNECLTHPCANGGECIDDVGSYYCVCQAGYTGRHCDSRSICEIDPCPSNSICVRDSHGEQCVCNSGYMGIPPNCTINYCANNPCLNGGTCTSGATCSTSFSDWCTICQNSGTCIEGINEYTCNCTKDFMVQNCEEEYDACSLNPCQNNGSCTLITRSRRDFVCECPRGFEGKVCDVNIDDCVDVICPDDKICVDGIDSHECKCREGYRDPNCTLIVYHCARNPCNNGTCIDLGDDGFECKCHPGFQDINECEIKETLCNNGICLNTEGSYKCFCVPGFSGDYCDIDIDECLGGPCLNNATCIDRINTFECKCPPGYSGKICDIDVNECESDPCFNGATCIDKVAAYTCNCALGFRGTNCEINIDDCEPLPCFNYGRCMDGVNDYICDCTDTGFEGSRCEINIDDCVSAPCVNDAVCIDDIKNYKCQCYSGYTGKNCEIDINECESAPCQFNGTCLERSNKELYKSEAFNLPSIFTQDFSYANASGYECLCVQGVIGKNCEVNINECESNPCLAGSCIDRIGGFTCECDEGFEGDNCQHDIDECKRYTPCVHGVCTDGRADYFCTCQPEYGGKNCSVELTGCMGNACQNNGTCWPYLVDEKIHRFNCTCPNGFHGEICNYVTTMSLNGSSYVLVNTTREEGYDIQFRFRTTLPNGLLAIGKGLTFYILELVNGKLNLHSSLLNKWEGVFIGSGLNNSSWQKVFVAINTTHLVLSANEEQTIYPISLNEGSNSNHTSFPMTYVGGTIYSLRGLTHGPAFFIGCTEDVVINGEWVYSGTTSKTVYMEGIEPGCPREEQCEPNPCKNGGHCTDGWRDFSCKCERPYLGHTCQYNMTAATFGFENITNGYVTVKVSDMARKAVRSIVDISMFIRTRQDMGDIFYLGSEPAPQMDSKSQDKTYIAAQLEGGELLVRIQFNGTEAYTVGGVKLNDGNNHLIQVIRNVTLVQVKINGTEYFRKTISASGQLNVTVLYLGGLPQASRYIRQVDSRQMEIQQVPQINFKGIIQDVQISNGNEIMVVEFFPLKAKDIPTPTQFGNVTFDHDKVLQGVLSDNVCISNPCNHSGTCHVTWNDFWCQCPRGYTGKTCQEMEFCQLQDCPTGSKCQNLDDGYECIANATFNGNTTSFTYVYGRMEMEERNESDITIDTIRITYRSNTGGTLMHMAPRLGEQHFTVSVYKDKITVSWRLDDQNHGTLSFGKNEPDGNWTSIILRLNNNSMECTYENSNDENAPQVSPNFSFALWYKLLFDGTVTLGGLGNTLSARNAYFTLTNNNEATNRKAIKQNNVDYILTTATPPYQMISGEAFKGCLGEVRIGSMLLHYFTNEEVYQNANFTPFEYLSLQNHNLSDNIGCQLCFDHIDCMNDGYCRDKANSYVCECLAGYAEDDCSINIDECIDNKCQNNATCVDEIANYSCICNSGWQGWLCDNDINECISYLNPCQHNGVCVNEPGSFRCECLDQFVGQHCEHFRLITCQSEPCKNGSTCTDIVNSKTGDNFTCTCMSGFEGTQCDLPYCQVQKCQNGGKCDLLNQTPRCMCPLGYTGLYCEINIDDCAPDADGNVSCKNDGKCYDEVNNFTCDCSGTGYTGPDCSLDVDECQDPLTDCGYGKCENLLEYTGQNCTESGHPLGSQAFNIAIIVGPIVGCLFLIAAGSLIALFMMARKKRATRGTYSPSAQEFSNPRVEMDNVMKPPPEERLI